MPEAEQTSLTGAAQAAGPTLLDGFRDAYAEVTSWAAAVVSSEPPQHETVKQQLLSVLARQTAGAAERLAEHERAELERAQYVMVAMADEVMLRLGERDLPAEQKTRVEDWCAEWARRPLETESYFGTHVAGEQIFIILDEILRDRPAVSSDLLSVYLTALNLGFRGRYRVDPGSPEPARYRRDLVRELRRVDPELVKPSAEVCPGTKADPRRQEPRRGLPSLRDGLLPLFIVVAAMLVVGHALWYLRTLDITDRLDQIDDKRERAAAARREVERDLRAAREAELAREQARTEEEQAKPPEEPEDLETDGGAP